jgi:type 1 glutamine amidotransferase
MSRTRFRARPRGRRPLLAALLVASSMGTVLASGDAVGADHRENFRILLFTRTAGFAHPSIPVAVGAIEQLGEQRHFGVDVTDDAGDFTPENLDGYAALVFISTTGNVLPEAGQRAALEGYIAGGGGFLGVHAASDMGSEVREGWSFYRELVGAAFRGHTATHVWAPADIGGGTIYEGPLSAAPPDAEWFGTTIRYRSWEPAHVDVEDRHSPAMRGWGRSEVRTDEWYGFIENPRPRVRVLATLDESSYNPFQGDMGPGAADHPIVWCQEYAGGRSVYTGLGHPAAAWSDPLFLRHILGGIRMAAGRVRFEC